MSFYAAACQDRLHECGIENNMRIWVTHQFMCGQASNGPVAAILFHSRY